MPNDEANPNAQMLKTAGDISSFRFRRSFVIRRSSFIIRSAFHSVANRAAALLMKVLFGCVARVRVVGCENANRTGGFLLAANHISHFDPFIISSVVGRKIDWMAMSEFFRFPVV